MKNIILIIVLCLSNTLCFTQKLFELKTNYNFSSNSLFNGVNFNDPDIGEWKAFEKKGSFNTLTNTLSTDILTGQTLSFNKTFSIEESNIIYWEGATLNQNSKLYLQLENGVISGFVEVNSNYTLGISHIGGNYYVLHKMIGGGNLDCDTHVYPESNDSNLKSINSITTCGGLYTYRMIIGYTPQFAATFSSTNRQERINDFLVDVVNSVNETYINSGLNVRARLAFSYQTHDGEYGNKDDDFREFTHMGPTFYTKRYDEVFGYISKYNADVAILLVAANIGGRANPFKNMAVYGKDGAVSRYGVAHEIGHMFGLEHNREEYNWFQKKILAYDSKKAYGYRCENFRTVMSYGDSRTRVHLYSDPYFTFPDSHPAGDEHAKARSYLQKNLGRVVGHNDPTYLSINNETLEADKTASYFAFSNIETSNLIVNGSARLNLRAQNKIILGIGTHLKSGSQVNVEIIGCENSVGFKSVAIDQSDDGASEEIMFQHAEEKIADITNNTFIISPNPASEQIRLIFKTDDSTSTIAIRISTVYGEHMYFNTYKNTNMVDQVLDVSSFKSGIYLISVQTPKFCKTEKLIISK